LVKGLSIIENASLKRKLAQPVRSRVFEVIGPYKMQERWEEITELPSNCLLLATRLTGICQADLRYVNCSRSPEILRERLPLPIFHEGVAEVLDVGDDIHGFSKGDLAVIAPNIPCYLHDPWKYPDVYRACRSCRPEGAGENLCEDVRFLSSNAPGLSRTLFVHLGSCLFPISLGVPEEIAVLTEPLTVVNRALKQVRVNFDDRVAVLGGGFMGYITATMLSKIVGIRKSDLLVTDIFDSKLEKLRSFATTVNVKETPLEKEFVSMYDVAFECAGGKASEMTIDQALSVLSPGGRCMLIGVSEDKIPVGTRTVLEKGLTLKGTTRSAATDFREVLEWLKKEDFRKALQQAVYPYMFPATNCESLLAACKVAENRETHGKVLIDWRKEVASKG